MLSHEEITNEYKNIHGLYLVHVRSLKGGSSTNFKTKGLYKFGSATAWFLRYGLSCNNSIWILLNYFLTAYQLDELRDAGYIGNEKLNY